MIFFSFILLLPLFSCKLEMVIEVFRHGAREPLKATFDSSNWEEINGDLTNTGIRQHYLLGRELRYRYIESQSFLSESFNQSEIYIRSTNLNRTIMSALSHLHGLYPLGTGPSFPEDYNTDLANPPLEKINFFVKDLGFDTLPYRFQTIPLHIVDEHDDTLLLTAFVCKNNKLFRSQLQKSQQYKNFNREFSNSFNKLASLLNVKRETNWTITSVTSNFIGNIICDIFQNNPITKNFDKKLLEELYFINEIEFLYTGAGLNDQVKLLSSPFLEELISIFKNKINDKDFQKKFYFFSAHDTTITPLMVALNFTNWNCVWNKKKNIQDQYLNCEEGFPPFASNLLFELHSIDSAGEEQEKKYFIKIIYNGKEMNLCEKLLKTCDWDEFNYRIQNYIIKNFENECIKKENLIEKSNYSEIITKFEKYFESKM